MRKMLDAIAKAAANDLTSLAAHPEKLGPDTGIYPHSVAPLDAGLLMMARDDQAKFLVNVAPGKTGLDGDFSGETVEDAGLAARKIPLIHDNALALRGKFAWTAPVSLRERQTTIGCGDRLGLASAGHLRALGKYRAAPVLAQQSIRELTLTNREYPDVVDSAAFLVFQEGWQSGYGADGDHLKTLADIDRAIDAGMTMITLDQTEVMHAEAENYSAAQVESEFARLPGTVKDHILNTYAAKSFSFAGAEITLSDLEARRCALMYLDACDFTKTVYEHLKQCRGSAFDLELSIDETTAPTLPAHHLFIVRELELRGVELSSLAPRFIGDFQKGIDYIGDLTEFEAQFVAHCAIARAHGNYKVSVHSGSDKFSVFPLIGKHTNLRLHLKTAGTSWLEALRVIAACEPALFRELFDAAEHGYPEALKLYHITADFSKVPPLAAMSDAELGNYLELDESRQLLHISYGVLLQNKALAPRFFAAMHTHEDSYGDFLDRHFCRHLETLGVPKL